MIKFKLRAAAALAAAVALFTSVIPASFAENDPDVIPVYEDPAVGEELSVAAAAPETSKFSYDIDNGILTVSLNDAVINNSTGKDVEAIIAVYDGEDLLRTKIYKISGDYKKVTVNDWQTDVSGVEDISVRAFMWSADGSCTPLEESSVLSNVPSTAYKVYGRVTATSIGGTGLAKDEVNFNVERSDDFDGRAVSPENGNTGNYIFKTGSTNARDMLFIYSEAYVVKNADTNEYTLVSIKPYGDSQTVTFAAKDVADDDPTIYLDYIGNGRIPVYKDENTTSTIKYNLADDVKIYVNGVHDRTEGTDLATDTKIFNYTGYNNETGRVTLVDMTMEGSTASDGKYDYIMVDYYIDAIVDYVITSSDKAKIYFKAQETRANKMEWDTTDPEVDIRFTKDGKEIDYTELAEKDVLSIQYDIVNTGTYSGSLTDGRFYNVLVSSNTVEGAVTSKNADDDTITIGGSEYDLVTAITGEVTGGYMDIVELGTSYKAYLDVFGYIAYLEENASDRNYGVIVAMYQESGRDYPTVRLVTSNGEIVAYECKDATEAAAFYEFATGETYIKDTAYSFKKTDDGTNGTIDVKNRIMTGQTVCTYKLSGDKIKFDMAFVGVGGYDLTYKASSNRLDTYQISDAATRIIDMDDYMSETSSSTKVRVLSIDNFEDEAEYAAYLFDRNNDGVYRFAIVFKGTSSVRPESQISVVKKNNGQKQVDNNTCRSYTVLKGGQEIELLVEDYAPALHEGDVVAYITDPDGYVEEGDLYILYSSGGSYEETFANLLSSDDFGRLLNSNCVVKKTDGRYYGRYEIAYNGNSSSKNDVFAYAGIVYKKTDKYFELLTSQSDGESQVMDAVDFALDADTNVYTYDFGKASGKGLRVVYGNSPIQNTSVFNEAYINYNNTIAWSNAGETKPQLAFVKEVDGKTTDVVFYVPADYDEGEAPEPDTEAHSIDYGVIVAMYQVSGDDYPTVRLVTANAEVVEYECKDQAEADKFYNYATDTYEGYQDHGFKLTDDTVRDRILNGQTVCTYKLTDNRISFDMEYTGVGAYDLEYNARTSRLGSYSISDETTRIIDMDEYMSETNSSNKVRALSTNNFEDEAEYAAYLFDRNNDGVYRFAIVFKGTSSIRPGSHLAVVKAVNGAKDVDSNTCNAYTVVRDGQEIELLVDDVAGAPTLYEGDVVAYTLNSDGYAERNNVHVLFSMNQTCGQENNSDYSKLLEKTLEKPEFKTMINAAEVNDTKGSNSSLTDKAIGNGAREITFGGTPNKNKEVYAYFGIVYKKGASNVELFTKQENGIADVNAVTDFSLSGANIYTFDFAERKAKGVRLSVGNSAPQNTSIFNPAYVQGSDKNLVDFDAIMYEDIRPQLAFIKEVDGDVTDAVFFVAP